MTEAKTQQIGARYQPLEVLGRGAFGEVLLCEDLQLDRLVAIKRLWKPDRAGVTSARLGREARLVASLSHPNLVPIYDQGLDRDGRLFLVYEYVEGSSLAEVLESGETPDRPRSLCWVRQLGEALQAAHEAGVVHRDVKPANVMVRGEQLLLCDFGLARCDGNVTRLTETGEAVGTPLYMASELMHGEPGTPSSDQWALAAIAFELLHGRPWRRGRTVAALAAEALGDAPVPHGDPRLVGHPELAPPLARALDSRPEERFPDVRSFLEALEGAREEAREEAPSSGESQLLPHTGAPGPRGPRSGSRQPWRRSPLFLVGSVAGACLAGGLVVAAWSHREASGARVLPTEAPEGQAERERLEDALSAFRSGSKKLDPALEQAPDRIQVLREVLSDPTAPLRMQRVLRSSLSLERLGSRAPESQELLERATRAIHRLRERWHEVNQGMFQRAWKTVLDSMDGAQGALEWKRVAASFAEIAGTVREEAADSPPASWSDAYLWQQLVMASFQSTKRVPELVEEALERVDPSDPGGLRAELLAGVTELLLGDEARPFLDLDFRESLLVHLARELDRGPGDQAGPRWLETSGLVVQALGQGLRRQDPTPSAHLAEAFDAALEHLWGQRGLDPERVRHHITLAKRHLELEGYVDFPRSPLVEERRLRLSERRRELGTREGPRQGAHREVPE